MANCYGQLAGSKVSEFRDALRKSLRVSYCESALKKLCADGERELSEKEQMSIIRMSSIVSGTNVELCKQAMQRAKQQLAKKSIVSARCKSPIEKDTGFCGSCNTLLVRWCVLTLLPLSTSLGRSCIGCLSDAEALHQIAQEFDWLPDKLRCPNCSMPLRSRPIFNDKGIQ